MKIIPCFECGVPTCSAIACIDRSRWSYVCIKCSHLYDHISGRASKYAMENGLYIATKPTKSSHVVRWNHPIARQGEFK